jgi:hypothetical protein
MCLSNSYCIIIFSIWFMSIRCLTRFLKRHLIKYYKHIWQTLTAKIFYDDWWKISKQFVKHVFFSLHYCLGKWKQKLITFFFEIWQCYARAFLIRLMYGICNDHLGECKVVVILSHATSYNFLFIWVLAQRFLPQFDLKKIILISGPTWRYFKIVGLKFLRDAKLNWPKWIQIFKEEKLTERNKADKKKNQSETWWKLSSDENFEFENQN